MGTLNGLIARSNAEVGYTEKDNANNLDSFSVYGSKNFTKYSRDVNNIGLLGCQGQPYCGVYQMWLEYKEFGKDAALKMLGGEFYNCFKTMAYAKKNNRWIERTGTPKAGYRVIFSQSHIALVTKVTGTYANGKIYTNEGNTADGAEVNRDGGKVCNKEYARNNGKILGYVVCEYADPVKASTTFAIIKTTYKKPSAKRQKMCQRMLKNTFGIGITLDGDFGNKSWRAWVKALQKTLNEIYNSGLVVDGRFGNKTKKACEKALIRKGIKQVKLVKLLKVALAMKGYFKYTMGGTFGNGLYKAFISYQNETNLTVDAICGKESWSSFVK